MKVKKIIFAAIFFCMVFAGCTNTYYTDGQQESVVNEGKMLITEYLNNRYSEYNLKNCNMMTGAKVDTNPYAGYYISDYVEGKYSVGAKNYTIVVNIKNGDVYTDEQNEAFGNYMKEKLRPYIIEAGYDAEFMVDDVQIEYDLRSENVQSGKENLDTQVFLYGVLPIKYNAENFDELISSDSEDGEFFNMRVLFHNDEVGKIPNDALKKFCKDHTFFNKGIIYVCNLNDEDFNDILSGKKNYHYSMKKIEEYSIFPEN